MRYGKINSLILLFFLLVILLSSGLSCEPVAPLKIKNETEQTLYIYVNHTTGLYFLGKVDPGKEIRNEDADVPILRLGIVPIEVKDLQGDILYSKEFTLEQLRDKLDWKVIIPDSFE